jgi:hypothetical protein
MTCPHLHVVDTSHGWYSFSGGTVDDNVIEQSSCLDCGIVLPEVMSEPMTDEEWDQLFIDERLDEWITGQKGKVMG